MFDLGLVPMGFVFVLMSCVFVWRDGEISLFQVSHVHLLVQGDIDSRKDDLVAFHLVWPAGIVHRLDVRLCDLVSSLREVDP